MVDLGGDINGIKLEPGDSITVNGNDWTYQADGTLSGPAVQTEEGNIGNISGALIQPHQAELQSDKSRFSWSRVPWEDKGEPIITGEGASQTLAGWPSVIHAESVLDNPIDTWYCYWSTHDYNYIALSTAADLWGPWSFHGEIFSDPEGDQTASPSALADPHRSRINLYYHTNPDEQHSKLATAPLTGDGTDFSEHSVVLPCPFNGDWDEQERSYLKVIRHQGAFLGVYQGRDRPSNATGIGIVASYDGERFRKLQSYPAFDNTHWSSYNPRRWLGGSPILSTVGGELMIHYGDGEAGEPRVLPWDLRETSLDQGGETVYSNPGWMASSDFPAVQDFVSDGEHLYMFYFAEPSYDIGVARVKLGDVQ